MPLRIAAASSDGKVVNRHFGAARQFLIFDVDGAGIRFVEKRESEPPCSQGAHDDQKLQHTIRLMADCDAVLVSRIGPVAAALLAQSGISAMEFGGFIEDAVYKLVNSYYDDRKSIKNE
ncbi:Predicted Fe-Mo cluster-binding protein, NifX family [Sporobacter termitidis DSM 10068]|uniref:Predicted Fe-Mo cluster-binding protein, NifX family n=1 Tax=Sporobacter termitidis DSM 10068 TaxID=1123282 RepID=A0A1M5TVL6_9FIRM|nr:NifB/NifX family molybdenum-iron cluster-binding protein [Sporobacter termitidis]SHH54636.1 Predicted Fe-Mo cluster-binding protein, NifX family [Sporobacter termitidis DSM 10068]